MIKPVIDQQTKSPMKRKDLSCFTMSLQGTDPGGPYQLTGNDDRTILEAYKRNYHHSDFTKMKLNLEFHRTEANRNTLQRKHNYPIILNKITVQMNPTHCY